MQRIGRWALGAALGTLMLTAGTAMARTPVAAGVSLLPAPGSVPRPASGPAPAKLAIEMRYVTLPNGLKLVLSRDTLAPTVTVSLYVGVGFRVERKGRTGFAHLFEHLMLHKPTTDPRTGTNVDFINDVGGVSNGTTRSDYTVFWELVPAHALERVLWMDVRRMAPPRLDDAILANTKAVVSNEVKGSVLNVAYGGWPELDLPMAANSNWYNAHSGYGDLADIEAATVADARQFHATYYRPNNSVLVIAGDIDYDRTEALVRRYFGPLPAGAPVVLPDTSEPRQTVERTGRRVDPLATLPGWSAGYRLPPRGTPEWYAMALIDQILLRGADSRLARALEAEAGITNDLTGGINHAQDTVFNYRGPMLWSVNFTHDAAFSDAQIRAAFDPVIERLRTTPVTAAELDRARVKARSALYKLVDGGLRTDLSDLLGSYALFDNDPQAVNRIEDGYAAVTPALIRRTAQEYLRPGNRTIHIIVPGATAAKGTK